MSESMTPAEARELLRYARNGDSHVPHAVAERTLENIAAMNMEEDHRVVDPDTVGGRYETRRYQRYVTEWQEVPR